MTGNLVSALTELAHREGRLDDPAFVVRTAATTASQHTTGEVLRGAAGVAAALLAHDVRPEDRVLIALPDGVEFVTAFLGALHVGAIAVPVNPTLPSRDLAVLLERADPAVVVGGPAVARAATGRTGLAPGEAGDPADAPPPVPRTPHDPAYAQFTSGTTGAPKLCFHGHGDPLVYDGAFAKPVLGLSRGAVTYSVSKAFFAYGLGNSVFFPLLNGATAVLDPAQPDEAAILDAITRFGVEVLYAVPSVYARLLAHPAADALRGLRLAVSAGEVLPRTVEDGFAALDGPVLLNGLGSTEVGQTFTANAPDARRTGTVGRALPPYQVRVVDEAGADRPAGVEGRLLVCGPTVVAGVPAAAERTAPTPGEWHATGDAATLDADGFLHVAGRLDDLEIISGVNVHPTEIEELFRAQPQVADAAVCSVTDALGVSRLVAYVVPKPDADPDEPWRAALVARLRGKLAQQKIPRGVVVVPDLPRTPTGKLRRHALRQAAAAHETTGAWQI